MVPVSTTPTSPGRGVQRNLLVDTGAFIALLDADDELHGAASDFYRRLPAGVPLATTQAVIAECYTFFRYRAGSRAALRWLDYLDEARSSGHMRVLYSDADDAARAEGFLRRFADQALSYTDALTLAAARRFDMGAIFAFDHHLALTGIPLLPGQLKA